MRSELWRVKGDQTCGPHGPQESFLFCYVSSQWFIKCFSSINFTGCSNCIPSQLWVSLEKGQQLGWGCSGGLSSGAGGQVHEGLWSPLAWLARVNGILVGVGATEELGELQE